MEKIIFTAVTVLMLVVYSKIELRLMKNLPMRSGMASLDALMVRFLMVSTLLSTVFVVLGILIVKYNWALCLVPLVYGFFAFYKAFLIIKGSLLYKKVEELKFYDRIVLKILRIHSGIIKREMPFYLLYEDGTRSTKVRLGKKIIGIFPSLSNEEFVLELFDMKWEYSNENLPKEWKLPHIDDMTYYREVADQDEMNEIIYIGGMPMNFDRSYWCCCDYEVESTENEKPCLVRRLVDSQK